MKKTLITLLAGTSIAMGVTLEEATLTFTTGATVPATYVTSIGDNAPEGAVNISGNGGFTIAVTLNPETLESYLTKDQTVQSIVGHKGNGGGGDYTTSIRTNGNGSLLPQWDNATPWQNKTFVTGLNNSETISWDKVTGAALTYVFSGSADATKEVRKGTSVFLTLVNADNEVIYAENYNLDGLVSTGNKYKELYFNTEVVTSAYVYNKALGTSDATSLTKTLAVIPEPATATLSLLALAGLAARRRRK